MIGKLFRKRRRAERRRTGIETLFGLIVTAVILFLYSTNIFRSLELSAFDWLTRLRGPVQSSPEIVIIELDQETIDSIDKWPLPRTVYARLLNILTRAGVHSVGFNILFTEESSPEADREFAEAISQAGMVYLPYYLKMDSGIHGPSRVVENTSAFKNAAKHQGHINMPPDSDGVVRRVLLNIPSEGKNHRQLAFRMAGDRLGVSAQHIDPRPGHTLKLKTGSGETISIPLDAQGAMIIDWNGRWRRAFRRYTVADIFDSEQHTKAGLAQRDILENLKGCICLVGLTAPGTFDAMRTPFEQFVPSIGIHATILSQILQGRFLHAESRMAGFLIILALGLGVSILSPKLKPVVGIIVIVAACFLYILFAVFMFFQYRTQFAILYPLAAMLLPYFSMSIHYEIVISRERGRLHHRATHDSLTDLFVVGHFRLLLDAEIAETQRNGEPLCLIMSDIDHFKNLNDTYGHQVGDAILKEVAKILKSSCRDLDIVARYGGEEFIMLLPGTTLEESRGVAERIRRTIEDHEFSHEGKSYRATVSLGVSRFDPSDSADDLIRKADRALYDAKRGGRNRVCIKRGERIPT